jgi:hypothetical protein
MSISYDEQKLRIKALELAVQSCSHEGCYHETDVLAVAASFHYYLDGPDKQPGLTVSQCRHRSARGRAVPQAGRVRRRDRSR